MKVLDLRWILVAIRRAMVVKGRARRAETWWYMLPLSLLAIGMITINALTFGDVAIDDSWYYTELAILGIAAIPGISAAIRRLHDLGRSGWWYLLIAVPVVGFMLAPAEDDTISDTEAFAAILILCGAATLQYWFLQRGTIGENRFGPDPLMVD